MEDIIFGHIKKPWEVLQLRSNDNVQKSSLLVIP